MAKLYFRYGAMNSGKSTALLQAAFNYEERGQRVLLAKPLVDTKGGDRIESRLGVTRPADLLIGPDDEVREAVRRVTDGARLACVLIDEAQFLTPEQVDDLLRIAVLDDIPVLAYGIRTDFRTEAFAGSRRLLELAHRLEELKTICRCGRKALFNARMVGGRFTFDGDQVAIDASSGLSASASSGLSTSASSGLSAGEGAGESDLAYESMCGECYLRESGGRLGGAGA